MSFTTWKWSINQVWSNAVKWLVPRQQCSSKTEKTCPVFCLCLESSTRAAGVTCCHYSRAGGEGGGRGLVTLLPLLLCPLMSGQGSWRLHYCSCVDRRARSVDLPQVKTEKNCENSRIEYSEKRKLCFVMSWFLWNALNVPSAATFSVPLVVAPSLQLLFLKAPHPNLIIYTLGGSWWYCFLRRKWKGVCGGIKGMQGL